MKHLFAKRWHSIPVGILSAVLAVCLLAGSAFAVAYPFWGGKAEVTVAECMTVSNLSGDQGDFDPANNTWTVTMYPGESKILYVRVSNASSAELPVSLGAAVSNPGVNALWSGGANTIAGKSSLDFTLTVTATGDAGPRGYTVYLSITRG